ncbi:hypothetical protein BU16DRAFT_536194 [Lophium mytilinum]|uniref:Uncharacterized protein n=1 Tax=Lophium mytilinum TaxID=390894 RepID=A0A6A6R841_9PEZI|nr:hypothetical protein BU16DRAFT_536194 [Lophium mytilinum]
MPDHIHSRDIDDEHCRPPAPLRPRPQSRRLHNSPSLTAPNVGSKSDDGTLYCQMASGPAGLESEHISNTIDEAAGRAADTRANAGIIIAVDGVRSVNAPLGASTEHGLEGLPMTTAAIVAVLDDVVAENRRECLHEETDGDSPGEIGMTSSPSPTPFLDDQSVEGLSQDGDEKRTNVKTLASYENRSTATKTIVGYADNSFDGTQSSSSKVKRKASTLIPGSDLETTTDNHRDRPISRHESRESLPSEWECDGSETNFSETDENHPLSTHHTYETEDGVTLLSTPPPSTRNTATPRNYRPSSGVQTPIHRVPDFQNLSSKANELVLQRQQSQIRSKPGMKPQTNGFDSFPAGNENDFRGPLYDLRQLAVDTPNRQDQDLVPTYSSTNHFNPLSRGRKPRRGVLPQFPSRIPQPSLPAKPAHLSIDGGMDDAFADHLDTLLRDTAYALQSMKTSEEGEHMQLPEALELLHAGFVNIHQLHDQSKSRPLNHERAARLKAEYELAYQSSELQVARENETELQERVAMLEHADTENIQLRAANQQLAQDNRSLRSANDVAKHIFAQSNTAIKELARKAEKSLRNEISTLHAETTIAIRVKNSELAQARKENEILKESLRDRNIRLYAKVFEARELRGNHGHMERKLKDLQAVEDDREREEWDDVREDEVPKCTTRADRLWDMAHGRERRCEENWCSVCLCQDHRCPVHGKAVVLGNFWDPDEGVWTKEGRRALGDMGTDPPVEWEPAVKKKGWFSGWGFL